MSERTVDADVATVWRALTDCVTAGWDQVNPEYTGVLPQEALAALDRLVARNQRLEETLVQVVNLLYPHPGVPTSPSKALEVVQATLASVRTRSET